MRATPLTLTSTKGIESLVHGAQSCVRNGSSLVPLRLPAWAWPQVPDALTAETFRQAPGVRLEMVTEATIVELDLSATRIAVESLDLPTPPSVVDLIVDGDDRGGETIDTLGLRLVGQDGGLLRTIEGPVCTVRFEGLEPVRKRLELWLPANASVRLNDLRANGLLEPAPQAARRWIHYGSSISHCSEARRPTETWPAVAARATGVGLESLGVGGSCHLDHFVARVIRDAAADCISLKVGINIVSGDTLKYRTFLPAVHGFLDTVRDGHPDTPLLVVSPIFCPALEDAQGPLLFDGRRVISGLPPTGTNALTLRRVREILASIVEERRNAGDERLFYLDGCACSAAMTWTSYRMNSIQVRPATSAWVAASRPKRSVPGGRSRASRGTKRLRRDD